MVHDLAKTWTLIDFVKKEHKFIAADPSDFSVFADTVTDKVSDLDYDSITTFVSVCVIDALEMIYIDETEIKM